MEVISKMPVTLAEVKELCKRERLEERGEGKKAERAGKEKEKEQEEEKKEEKEIRKAEAAALEYANRFCKVSLESALKMKEELKALGIVRLSDEDIVKIIDIMPIDIADVRKILGISLEQNEIQKILEIVQKHRK
jgi:DNA-directed RNA polymerase subunit F